MTAQYLPPFAPPRCHDDVCTDPPSVTLVFGDGSPIPGLPERYYRKAFCVRHASELIGRGWRLIPREVPS